MSVSSAEAGGTSFSFAANAFQLLAPDKWRSSTIEIFLHIHYSVGVLDFCEVCAASKMLQTTLPNKTESNALTLRQ